MVNNEVGLAVRINAARGKRSLLWLSTESGIPYTTLARNLKNPGNFKVSQLQQIADALGVPFGRIAA